MNFISCLFRRYRAAAWLGAVSIIAFFATNALAQIVPPAGLDPRGQLRLQMGDSAEMGPGGEGHDPRRFVYEPIIWDPTIVYQGIGVKSKCILVFTGPATLTVLSSTGGNDSGDIGVGPDSLGVPDGPKGVACYRFSSNKNEAIEFSLGPDTIDPTTIDANAFYGLELDVEVKKNAKLFLEVLIGGSVVETYELRTGSNIVPGEEGATIFNCAAQSDSGPDAGIKDNCRWIIAELGQSFRMWAAQGEASWEGGGDFVGDAYENNSIIYLAHAEDIGALGCVTGDAPGGTDTSGIGDGENDAACKVTRLDSEEAEPVDLLVEYRLRVPHARRRCRGL